MIRALRQGEAGETVQSWQSYLRGTGRPVTIDGDFGPKTEAETKRWQKLHGLAADGIVGAASVRVAIADGWAPFEVVAPAPDAPRLLPMSLAQMESWLGPLPYEPDPTSGNPERVRVDAAWERQNLVRVRLLYAGKGAGKTLRVHRHFREPLLSMWAALESEGALDDVLTINGAFVPRFVRGSTTTLSNHAYGLAIDLNASWNRLGTVPAAPGEKGSLWRVARIAARFGIGSGAHWRRPDGMHLALAKPV